MKLSRRSLFTLALTPAVRAQAKPITMQPAPECCGMVMCRLKRYGDLRPDSVEVDLAPFESLFECNRCQRRAIVSDMVLADREVKFDGNQHRYGLGFEIGRLDHNEREFERKRKELARALGESADIYARQMLGDRGGRVEAELRIYPAEL